MPKIAFLGPNGSFSYQATLQQFPKSFSYCPQASIADCFQSLCSNEVDYSVVPLENSTNGQVAFTYDLLRDFFFKQTQSPCFSVVGEQFVSIHHNLLSECKNLSQITKIYSHPQVWSQCTNFFSKIGPIHRVDTSSTSQAAKLVADDIANGITNTAAICSVTAAQFYNLQILKSNIEDDSNNTTRFLVLRRTLVEVSLNSVMVKEDETGKKVSMIALTLGENPGSLCNVLSLFKNYNINLTNITSRPSHKLKWNYVFFVEFWGDSIEESVQKCLKEVSAIANLKLLGTFTRDSRYFNNEIKSNSF